MLNKQFFLLVGFSLFGDFCSKSKLLRLVSCGFVKNRPNLDFQSFKTSLILSFSLEENKLECRFPSLLLIKQNRKSKLIISWTYFWTKNLLEVNGTKLNFSGLNFDFRFSISLLRILSYIKLLLHNWLKSMSQEFEIFTNCWLIEI